MFTVKSPDKKKPCRLITIFQVDIRVGDHDHLLLDRRIDMNKNNVG